VFFHQRLFSRGALVGLGGFGRKKALLDGAPEIFQRGRNPAEPEAAASRIKDLHAKIGEVTVERDFLEQGLRLLPSRSARR
jgi:hypothetical protein